MIQNHRCTPCDNCTQLLLDDLDQLLYNLRSNSSHIQGGVTPPWSKLDGFEKRYVRLHDDLQSYQAERNKANSIIDKANSVLYESKLPRINGTVQQLKTELDYLLKDGSELVKNAAASSEKLDRVKNKLLDIIQTLNKFGSSHETTKNALAKARKLMKEIKAVRNKFKTEYNYSKIIMDCERVSENAANISRMLFYPDDLGGKLEDFNRRLTDLKEISLKTDVLNGRVEALNTKNKQGIKNLTRVLESLDLYGTIDGINNDIAEVGDIKGKIIELLRKTEKNYDLLRNDKEYKQLLVFLEDKEKQLREQNPQVQEYLRQVEEHVKNLQMNVTEYQK